MRANLDAARGLPMTENVAGLLAAAVGPVTAHDLVCAAAARASEQGAWLPDAMLADESAAAALADAGVGRAELEYAINPDNYLGASAELIRRAVAGHRATAGRPAQEGHISDR